MIPQIKELNFPRYATLSQATVTLQDMAEKTITTQVKIDGGICPDFSYDWELEFKGEKYIMPLRLPQAAKENASLNSTIDLTFQHWAIYQLKRWPMFSIMETETGTVSADKYIVPVTLNLKEFCTLYGKVLNYYYGDAITIDLNPKWLYSVEPTTVKISYTYMWDLLIKFYEQFAVRWQIEPNGDIEHYVIKVGYPTTELSHIFKYGFDGGLLKVERQVQDENIRNMLLGRGGEKNLPYRYFKDIDSNNTSFPADPDWIPELRNVYFAELRPKTFRDYVKGWKTNSHRQLTEADGSPILDKITEQEIKVEPYDEEYGEACWAYKRGHEAAKFDPVEYVKNDNSIRRYGPLLGGLDNNEDIYPSIQGVTVGKDGRIDEVVAVEQITDDDIEEAVAEASQVYNIDGMFKAAAWFEVNQSQVLTGTGGTITIPKGKTGDVDLKDYFTHARWYYENSSIVRGGKRNPDWVLVSDVAVWVENIEDPEKGKKPAIGITEGTWEVHFSANVQNGENPLNGGFIITIGFESPTYTLRTDSKNKWCGKFDIWVKNIWGTTKGIDKNGDAIIGETEDQYVERVWRPILGDREGNEAKVVFSTGDLSTSEDYEFLILAGGVHYDTSKTFEKKDANGQTIGTYTSEWRLTLGKSDADLESTGLYVPSTMRNGKAGDCFFFVGIDMPYQYVTWAEERIDNYKTDELAKVCDIKPTWVVGLDKVRITNTQNDETETLFSQLEVGRSIRIADKRFILNAQGTEAAYETLYLQSITYTYNEPTSDSSAVFPDVEVVLSDSYETIASPVSTLQGSVDALQKQLGSISNIEQIVRLVGDKLYLRKDGIEDTSLSPTSFGSLLTSLGFRQGILGGSGWGFYKDANNNWVLETDCINIRQEMQVNNIIINQIVARGGMIVESAASMEITNVSKTADGYFVCYFDQKEGDIANLFQEGDIAMSMVFSPDNVQLKYYKRRVVAVSPGSVTLAANIDPDNLPQGWIDDGVNGSGVPSKGDVIVHYGSYTNSSRQYVKVRDVVGGGYERYIEGLSTVHTDGVEYYFVGKQDGKSPRWFIGCKNGENGHYIEWKDGILDIKGRINLHSTVDSNDQLLEEYIKDQAGRPNYLLDLTNEVAGVACDSSGNVIGSLPRTEARVFLGQTVDSGWTFLATGDGCSVSVNGNIISITGITAQSATVTITASKQEQPSLKSSMSIYKVMPGENGSPAITYSLLPSVSSIICSTTGQLSASTVYCDVLKTSGASATVLSNDHNLYYTRIPDGATGLLPRVNGRSPKINVLESTTSIVFELRNASNVVLDRESIPVVRDASGLELGGVNLLRNSGFENYNNTTIDKYSRINHWYVGTLDGVTIDSEKQLNGSNSVKVSISGSTGNTWRGPYQGINDRTSEAQLDATPGQWFTASVWAYCEDLSFDDGATLEVRWYTADWKEIRSFPAVSCVPSVVREWHRFHITVQAPAPVQTDDGVKTVAHVGVALYVGKNGTIWFAQPKLERGTTVSEWSPSPDDFDYLKAALKESSSLEGGLALMSHIRMGYHDQNGNLKVTAGVNGLVDPEKNFEDLSFWSGGDQIDAAKSESTDHATFAIRMNGTGYAANNTIRFEKNAVWVGDNVKLDDQGLALLDESNNVRLQIKNTPIGDFTDAIQTVKTFSVTVPAITGCKVFVRPGGQVDANTGTVRPDAYSIGRGTSIVEIGDFSSGTSLTFSRPTGGSCNYNPPSSANGTTILGATISVSFGIMKTDSSGKKYFSQIAEFNDGPLNVSIKESGTYAIQATGGSQLILIGSVELSGTTASFSPIRIEEAKEYTGIDTRTIIGVDGLKSIWNGTSFLVKENVVGCLAGKYGLQVTPTGFKYTTNSGGTWSEWNPAT